MRKLIPAVLLASSAFAADPTLAFVGTWPKNIAVMDEGSGKIIEQIILNTDAARTLLPTQDKTKLIAITVRDAGIETIDLKSRKVVDSFVLGSPTKRVRINGSALDPSGKYLYIVMNVANKLIDRFEIEKPQFAIVDLAQKKILRTVELPKEVAPVPAAMGGGRGGGQMRVSPDGKFLWFFRDNIYIVDTADFKVVETIKLAQPEFPYMETISLSGTDDPNDEPGKMTAIFTTTDPIVHRRVFGITQIDLNTRKIDFAPIGPAIANINGTVRLSPDRKFAYGVEITGIHGDRYCDFFTIDMNSRKIVQRASFPGRTRFTIGMTADGKSLIVYGAGHTMELYDSATLKFVRAIDMNADMTSSMVAIPPRPAAQAAVR